MDHLPAQTTRRDNIAGIHGPGMPNQLPKGMKRTHEDEGKTCAMQITTGSSGSQSVVLPADRLGQTLQADTCTGNLDNPQQIPPPMPMTDQPAWAADLHLNLERELPEEPQIMWWNKEYWYWDEKYYIWWTRSRWLYHPDTKIYNRWGGGDNPDTLTPSEQDLSQAREESGLAATDMMSVPDDTEMASGTASSSHQQPLQPHFDSDEDL